MPIWSEILGELSRSGEQGNGAPDFDAVRRKYLRLLHRHTGRNVILYASGWQQKENAPANAVSITDEDIQGFMEVCAGLKGANLDLILHSPGGSLETAEAIVKYLRSKFSHIRIIVPQLAMSAATMIACAGDEIVLGKHSFLGPTDPQLLLTTPLGLRFVPAQAVLDQFDKAQNECADPAKLSAWLPMLSQYGPALLIQCESALDLSRELVNDWLESYMFKGDSKARDKAEKASEWLTNHGKFKSHNRHLSREDILQHLPITRLEKDNLLQDLSLSVFHAATHAFSGTGSLKIIENHLGRAFIKMMNPAIQTPKG